MKILTALLLLTIAHAAQAMPCIDEDGNNVNIRTDRVGSPVLHKGKHYKVVKTESTGEGSEDVTLQNSTDQKDEVVFNCEYNSEG